MESILQQHASETLTCENTGSSGMKCGTLFTAGTLSKDFLGIIQDPCVVSGVLYVTWFTRLQSGLLVNL